MTNADENEKRTIKRLSIGIKISSDGTLKIDRHLGRSHVRHSF